MNPYAPENQQRWIAQAIELALAEDIGTGCVTCDYFVDPAQQAHARLIAKESGVLAGSDVAAAVFQKVDPELRIDHLLHDGAEVSPGSAVLEIQGAVRSLLTAERVALNFIQRLSGIATLTRRFVEQTEGTRAKILDTRKTTPGLRTLEKVAVKAGGGENHRFALYDMVMVKDNHLAARGDLAFLQRAIDRLHAERPEVKVELEADTLEQVRGFLTLSGVAVILLDNMSPEEMREAVALAQGRVALEASGGVNLDTVSSIAATGVDYISAGALTHSARALDFSLELSTPEA